MRRLAPLLGLLTLCACVPTAAPAAPVTIQSADLINESPVSNANPLPSTLVAHSGRWSYAAANLGIVNTTTAVTIKAAAGAGVRNYVTGCQVWAEALGTATELAIRDGAGGTVLWRTKIGTGGLTGGRDLSFSQPLVGTANTLLEVVTLTASGTGAVYVNCQGYAAP